MSGKARIGELRIRASGLTPEQARALGRAVAERLSQSGLQDSQSRTIRSMNVSVRGPARAEEIAAQIRRKLR